MKEDTRPGVLLLWFLKKGFSSIMPEMFRFSTILGCLRMAKVTAVPAVDSALRKIFLKGWGSV